MEPTDDFEREAFSAAGPVFLVAIGVVVLGALGVFFLFGALDAPWSWIGFAIGAGLLVFGLAWGAIKNRDAPAGDAES